MNVCAGGSGGSTGRIVIVVVPLGYLFFFVFQPDNAGRASMPESEPDYSSAVTLKLPITG